MLSCRSGPGAGAGSADEKGEADHERLRKAFLGLDVNGTIAVERNSARHRGDGDHSSRGVQASYRTAFVKGRAPAPSRSSTSLITVKSGLNFLSSRIMPVLIGSALGSG
jgi:hypothetical protein